MTGAPGEEIPAYWDKFLPAKIPLSQKVIASLDGAETAPYIHVLLDPPPALLEATREAGVFDETGSEEFNSILQDRGGGDQIRKGAADLTLNMGQRLPHYRFQSLLGCHTCFILMIS